MPVLMFAWPVLRMNMSGDSLPEAATEGCRSLKIPIDAFPSAVWGDA